MNLLKGKGAVVTGAASSIGEAIMTAFMAATVSHASHLAGQPQALQ